MSFIGLSDVLVRRYVFVVGPVEDVETRRGCGFLLLSMVVWKYVKLTYAVYHEREIHACLRVLLFSLHLTVIVFFYRFLQGIVLLCV